MKPIKITILLIALLLTPALLAANEPEQQQPVKDQETEKQHTASIVEASKGEKYIYLEVEESGNKTWIATLPSFLGGEVKPGDRVHYSGGVEMTGFKSKELDKTFDKILFITKIKKAEAPRLNDLEHVPADNYHSQFVKQEKDQTITAPAKGEIEKAGNGKNIEEIFSEAEKLKGKEVLLRARVLKVSKKILSKNWLTLQDGTGTPPDNKLTVTTLDTAVAGDIVTVKGILKTDVNLGAGYFYKLILEEAVIVK
ncbi:MAG: hypothetical protein HZC49_14495 [Nitrospirae bacterium]|nr:hypothetical protein [Nitrospirota bacterium]